MTHRCQGRTSGRNWPFDVQASVKRSISVHGFNKRCSPVRRRLRCDVLRLAHQRPDGPAGHLPSTPQGIRRRGATTTSSLAPPRLVDTKTCCPTRCSKAELVRGGCTEEEAMNLNGRSRWPLPTALRTALDACCFPKARATAFPHGPIQDRTCSNGAGRCGAGKANDLLAASLGSGRSSFP